MPGLPHTPRSPRRNPPRPAGGNVCRDQSSPLRRRRISSAMGKSVLSGRRGVQAMRQLNHHAAALPAGRPLRNGPRHFSSEEKYLGAEVAQVGVEEKYLGVGGRADRRRGNLSWRRDRTGRHRGKLPRLPDRMPGAGQHVTGRPVISRSLANSDVSPGASRNRAIGSTCRAVLRKLSPTAFRMTCCCNCARNSGGTAMTCSGRGVGDTAGTTGAGTATDHARIAADAQVTMPPPPPCGRERLPGQV